MILSLDTFSEYLGISLIDGHNILVRQTYRKLKPFSELLLDRVDSIFKHLGYDPSVLFAVCVNKGPGSYTALRVGITAAKTISYSLNIPIYAYTSLEAMAYKYRHYQGVIKTVVNAGKGECYISDFISSDFSIKQTSEIKLVKIKDFEKSISDDCIAVVSGINMTGKNIFPLTEDLSVEGTFMALKKGLKEDNFLLEPVYIRSA